MPQIREADRWAIVTFKRFGFKNEYIKKTMGVNENTVSLWWLRYQNTNDVKDFSGGKGRP